MGPYFLVLSANSDKNGENRKSLNKKVILTPILAWQLLAAILLWARKLRGHIL